ncbi:MarR family transcriptional regulator [Halosimplex sp. J119]
MPIDVEEFEEAPESELRATGSGPTNAERVLSFLSEHDDQAFTPKEIRMETGIPRGSIGVVLSRLEDSGLVRHRGEYWALAPDTDVSRALESAHVARAASDRLGAEDPAEWGPGLDESEDA